MSNFLSHKAPPGEVNNEASNPMLLASVPGTFFLRGRKMPKAPECQDQVHTASHPDADSGQRSRRQ